MTTFGIPPQVRLGHITPGYHQSMAVYLGCPFLMFSYFNPQCFFGKVQIYLLVAFRDIYIFMKVSI